MWKEFGISYSYSLEASFFGYRTKKHENIPFTQHDCLLMGRILGRAIHEVSYYEVEKQQFKIYALEQFHSRLLMNEKKKGNYEAVKEIIQAIE